MKSATRVAIQAALCTALCAAAQPALAQTYPTSRFDSSSPIRPAARRTYSRADRLEDDESWKQQVIVDNRAGRAATSQRS